MKEIDELTVKKIVRRMHADALNRKSSEYFLTLNYKANQFNDIIDTTIFKTVVSYLPNIKHHAQPFVLSVAYNIKTNEFDITVINPRLRA